MSPKNFYCQKIFKFKKKTQNFPNTSKTNPSNKSKFPRLPKIPLSYVLNNNFSYTEIYRSLVIQKDSYYIHNDTDALFFFFFFRKKMISFTCFILKFFVFLIILSCLFIYRKKSYKKNLNSFFISFKKNFRKYELYGLFISHLNLF